MSHYGVIPTITIEPPDDESPSSSNQIRQPEITKMEEMIELIVRMMFVLNERFPFLKCFKPTDVNVEMFHRPNQHLMSRMLHYLLNIINPEKCTLLVPDPSSVKSIAHFHRGATKFLNQTFTELPHVKIDGFRPSTLSASTGELFVDFLARLVTITVQFVYEKFGVVSVPNPIGVDAKERLNIMQAKEDRNTQELFFQRYSNATRDAHRYEESLDKLKTVRERLRARLSEIVSSCPSPYKESPEGVNPEIAVANIKNWQSDLNSSLGELSREQETSEIWRDAITGGVGPGYSNEPTRLEGDKLLNSKNIPVISKVAKDQKIKLFEGPALSISGFLECSSVIAEKLNALIMTSKFRDSIECHLALETPIDSASKLNLEMSSLLHKTEEDVTDLKARCEELQRVYDELVAEGEITHRFSYSQSFPEPEMKMSSLQTLPDLMLSPEHSWKEEVEVVKRKFKKQQDIPVLDNLSTSNLSRIVLQKQVMTLGSRGVDSTFREMFQDPLSSSSPVTSAGNRAHVPTRKSLSAIIDDVTILDAELNDFLADVSTMSSYREDSAELSPEDSTIRMVDGNIHHTGMSTSSGGSQPVPVELHSFGPPKSPVNNTPSAPIRRPRPSLEAIVNRYKSMREKMDQ